MIQTTRANPNSPCRAARVHSRGFALPLVIMLALVASVLIAAMLDRQSGQRLTIAREVRSYQDIHFGRGVREILDQWIRSAANRSIRDLLAADGKAMDIELGDGTTIEVHMYDAQASLLINPAGLNPDDAADLGAIYESLRETSAAADLQRLTRRQGPASISILTAPVELLTALSHQIGGGQSGDECFRELLALRDKPSPAPKDIADLAATLNLEERQRQTLLRLCVVDPTYYRVILEARAANAAPDARPIARYEAYIGVNRPGLRAGGGLTKNTNFLSWRKLELP